MRATTTFSSALVALMLMSVPSYSQTRKEKKAAEKARWEMEQKHQQEEAELRHKLRMDSIANASKKAEEKAAAEEQARKEALERYEAQQRKAEAEAKAEEERQAAIRAAQETAIDEPCMDASPDATYIRARGIAESLQHQMARTKAQSGALRDLAAKVGVTVKSVLKSYVQEESTDVMTDETSASGMYIEEKVQNMVKQVVDQNLSYSTYCEETRTYMKNNRKMYKCYMTVQAEKEAVLKPLYDQIQKDDKLRLESDYQKFTEEFDKEFDKQ